MNKKFVVGLLYLKVNNLGDVVIHDTTKYLLHSILEKQEVDYHIKSIDIGDASFDDIMITPRRKTLNAIRNCYLNCLEKNFAHLFSLDTYLLEKHWYKTKYYLYLKHRVLKKLKNVDVIIFAGGGLIKYHEQDFYHIINVITKYALHHHIPVLFNSVGVEGYYDLDARCQLLKKALNRRCVRAISTRDDIDTLNSKYLKKTKAKLVCDPALWTKETYRVEKKESTIVGIGVIRPEIFKHYLYDVEEEVLLKLFSELILLLKEHGYQVKLFTNGAIRDQKFILKIKEYMNANDDFDEMIEARPKKSAQLIQLISNYKAVIGTRLHSNIIAYSLGIPIVGIVWNNKQLLFGKINHCLDYFITKENFTASYVFNKLMKAQEKQKLNISDNKQTVYDFLEHEILKLLKQKK